MKVHFINVGQGNMVLIQIPSPNDKIIICDCNITNDNKEYVLKYLNGEIGNKKIDIFINTHRDADHMRGIEILNSTYGIEEIWDSGVAGTTIDCSEYRTYMNLRREKGVEKKPFTYETFGDVIVRIMNGKNEDFSDANDQSLVIKLEYGDNSALLAGDTSYLSWKKYILPKYNDEKIKSTILLASHHGSISFFDDPSDNNHYYTAHINKIKPKITIISVGDNDTHPDKKAVELHEKYSTGYGDNVWKILTTVNAGTIRFELNKDGSSKAKKGL